MTRAGTSCHALQDEIRPQDKEALRKLCTAQSHYLVRGAAPAGLPMMSLGCSLSPPHSPRLLPLHLQVTPEVLRELDHSRGGQRGGAGALGGGLLKAAGGGLVFGAAPLSGGGPGAGLSSWAAGASFVMGAKGGAAAAAAGQGAGPGGARVFGAATFAARPQVAVIGKNVSENVKSMPPVMMLD